MAGTGISIGGPIAISVTPEPPTVPYGVPCCLNNNPSGNQEWELYRIAGSSNPNCPDPTVNPTAYDPDDRSGEPGGENGPAPAAAPDEVVTDLGVGFHNITLNGMDPNNLNFLNVSADVFAGDAFDFGDAPDSYSTSISAGGPQHDIDTRLVMGAEIDLEFDGLPSAAADSDDNAVSDDEDGVASFAVLNEDDTGTYTVDVVVRNELSVAATLNGWIDFNQNGVFDTPSEFATAAVAPGATSVALLFTIPADIGDGVTYARFRLSSDGASIGTPGGESIDGEVEDYTLTIDPGQQADLCVVILDEEAIDNDISTIEQTAAFHGVEPDWLVNDNNPVEVGNPWLNWNINFPGDIVLIPSGQTQDEGWFFLPENPPWSVEDFVAGTIPQDQLDKIDNVQPLDNDDLMALVGQTCIAIVYDSDISINYDNPINGNLQGARYGKFAFTVLEAQNPSLPESTSSSSLKDMLIRVEGTNVGDPGGSCSGNTAGEVKDNFTDQVYSNNDGNRNWASNWAENDSSGSQATGGNVKITNGKLRLRRQDSAIQREVDLCASSNATLSFRYKMSNRVDADDEISVEVSSDGGSNWTVLEQIIGKTGWTTANYDISAFATANTRVRFRIGDSYNDSGEWFIVNWLSITSD